MSLHAPRAVLIDVIPTTMDDRDALRRLHELESLTHTYGGITVVRLIQRRATPDYKTYVGSGKLEEALELMKNERAELLIINNLLKTKQMFEIETRLRAASKGEKRFWRVWDRVDLILHIFEKHAKTQEAKLQIDLAAIHHMGPRIFGMSSELGRTMGGVGGRGGQGETNTELMKRHLAAQEDRIKKDLVKCRNMRDLHRTRRDRLGFKTVSLVGYTNAGKSSLLNALTKKGAYVADALFATLDTRVGRVFLPDLQANPFADGRLPPPKEVLVSDTIGFIQDLPPQLIEAFRSTLDETVEADLLVHVIDVGDPFLKEKIDEVEDVLRELDVLDTPRLMVFNKIDALKRIPRATLKKTYKAFTPCFVSCTSGEGLDELKTTLAKRLFL